MILVDISGVGYAQTAANNLMSDGVQVGGVFGALKALRAIKREYPGKMIVAQDGKSWRKDVYPEYKANRQSNPDLVKIKESWIAQKPVLVKFLHSMGVAQVFAANYEADDLIAKAIASAYRNRPITIVSGDKDLIQLIDDRVTWFDPVRDRKVTTANFTEFTNCANTWQFVQVKALSGDQGDNIKPVGGVGPKAAEWIFQNYGSVDALMNESMAGDSSSWPKKIVDFCDDPVKVENYRRNLLLVDLNHAGVPKADKPKLLKDEMNVDGFCELAEGLNFTSMLRDPGAWLAPFADNGY